MRELSSGWMLPCVHANNISMRELSSGKMLPHVPIGDINRGEIQGELKCFVSDISGKGSNVLALAESWE